MVFNVLYVCVYRALGVPVTDHTYDDCRLMQKASKLHMPANAGLVEFEKLHKKLGWEIGLYNKALQVNILQ